MINKFYFLPFLLATTVLGQVKSDVDLLDTPQIIEARGFKCETHNITTNDGYILTVFRIIHPTAKLILPNPLKPVLMQSGFLGSSDDFLINAPDGFVDQNILLDRDNLDTIDFAKNGRNLGFILANLGFDVWLLNPRGNYYSRDHVKLNPADTEFWKFSFDEIALIDLPTTIDYVLKQTEQKTLSYIGFSRGSITMFALLSDKPDYADKIKPFVAIAPAVFMNNYQSPLRLLIANPLIAGYIRDRPNQCLPRGGIKYQGPCSNFLLMPICDFLKHSILSLDSASINNTRLDIYLSHVPSGAACWDFVHFSQAMRKQEFTKLDFNPETNLEMYGTLTAPQYNLSAIRSNDIVFVYSENDATASPKDVKFLEESLKVPILDEIVITTKQFNHLDFIFGLDIGTLVNQPIVGILDKYREN